MDDELRHELNRIHARLRAQRLLLARIAARHFDEADLRAWNERLVAQFESLLGDAAPDALTAEALNGLMPDLLQAAQEAAGKGLGPAAR